MDNRLVRALQGALLSFIYPLAWILFRLLLGVEPLNEISLHPYFYLFLSVTSILLFATFGFIIGNFERNIRKLTFRDSLTEMSCVAGRGSWHSVPGVARPACGATPRASTKPGKPRGAHSLAKPPIRTFAPRPSSSCFTSTGTRARPRTSPHDKRRL